MSAHRVTSQAAGALRRQEDEAVAAVAGPRLMEYTAGIARWVRLSGEPDERRAFEYVEGVLKDLGMTTRLIDHDAFISLPGPARMEIVDPVREALPCITHAFAAPTGSEGIEGLLVYAADGMPEEYAHADLRDKIVLIEGLGIGGKVRRGGAIAQIFIHGDYTHETGTSP